MSTGALTPLRFTLTYAPPECVYASLCQETMMISHPSLDVFTLGMVAYELLTQTTLFVAGEKFEDMRDTVRCAG